MTWTFGYNYNYELWSATVYVHIYVFLTSLPGNGKWHTLENFTLLAKIKIVLRQKVAVVPTCSAVSLSHSNGFWPLQHFCQILQEMDHYTKWNCACLCGGRRSAGLGATGLYTGYGDCMNLKTSRPEHLKSWCLMLNQMRWACNFWSMVIDRKGCSEPKWDGHGTDE